MEYGYGTYEFVDIDGFIIGITAFSLAEAQQLLDEATHSSAYEYDLYTFKHG